MIWILTIAGTALILLALRDIFHTLWHPGGFGTLARLVFATTWRAAKVGGRARFASVAGPFGLLGTLLLWTLLLVVGFALIYLPRMPGDFYYSSSLQPQDASGFGTAVYLSVVALATLGLGDIMPATSSLRLLVPTEALLGFLLLTAGISWILQLYPALIRRRSLARQLTSMSRHGAVEVVLTGDASIAVQLLEKVRGELAGAEMDLRQYGESYYFREQEPDVSLAAALPFVTELVHAGRASRSAEVRTAAAMLDDGLGELLALLRQEFLEKATDDADTLAGFTRDHGQPSRA